MQSARRGTSASRLALVAFTATVLLLAWARSGRTAEADGVSPAVGASHADPVAGTSRIRPVRKRSVRNAQPATVAATGVTCSDAERDARYSNEGRWRYLPESNGVAPTDAATERAVPPTWHSVDAADAGHCAIPVRRFTRAEALQCLAGKTVLFYGNSNTRTLYTALEALLKGAAQISRLMAKQLCDNSKRNHSCSCTVLPDGGAPEAHAPIPLFYWGYVKDVYNPLMDDKMKFQKHTADIIVGNAGLNVMQLVKDGVWEKSLAAQLPKLSEFIDSFSKPGRQFFWQTTTRICEHQPHFKRFKYQDKFWLGRSLNKMNTAVEKSNEVMRQFVLSRREGKAGATAARRSARLLDGAVMIDRGNGAGAERGEASPAAPHNAVLCPFYDDPLHHRFLDVEMVHVLLNSVCPATP
jgi:hypothetical protein